MHDTPFEDENNTIREIFYLDVEENKFVRESLKARYEPEAYVRRRQIGTNPSRHLASIRSALESPVILDIGFYFDKSCDVLLIPRCVNFNLQICAFVLGVNMSRPAI